MTLKRHRGSGYPTRPRNIFRQRLAQNCRDNLSWRRTPEPKWDERLTIWFERGQKRTVSSIRVKVSSLLESAFRLPCRAQKSSKGQTLFRGRSAPPRLSTSLSFRTKWKPHHASASSTTRCQVRARLVRLEMSLQFQPGLGLSRAFGAATREVRRWHSGEEPIWFSPLVATVQ